MCLQVPLRVQEIVGEKVIVEGGRQFMKGSKLEVAPGTYVIPYGNMVVSVLSANEGKKMRIALGKCLTSQDNE